MTATEVRMPINDHGKMQIIAHAEYSEGLALA